MPARKEMPGTLRRSPKEAQRTWEKTHDSAVETYGEGERAHRTAFASLKHSFEKIGDRWMPKKSRGPSDKQAARTYRAKPAQTAEGVDENASKAHLTEVARDLGIRGRSTMSKKELVDAIQKANATATRTARGRR